jgi:hypothetical protein
LAALSAGRRRGLGPFVLDETLQNPADARRATRAGVARGPNIKLAKSGLLRSLAILEAFAPRAVDQRKSVYDRVHGRIPVGLSAAVHFALGTGAFDYLDLDSDLILRPTPARGGYRASGPLGRPAAPRRGGAGAYVLKNPVDLAGVLAGTVALLLRARRIAPVRDFFSMGAVPFYAYFLPALLTAFGLLPARQHALYDAAGAFLLPPCLALLILNADLAALRKLGRPAVGALALGFAGVMAGMWLAHGILSRWLPDGAWAGAGALAASWTGGSANMIAVKEGLSAPESAFAPIIVWTRFSPTPGWRS